MYINNQKNYVSIKIHLQHITFIYSISTSQLAAPNNLSTSVALQDRCQQQRGLNLRPKTSADFQPPGSWGKESGEMIFTFTRIHFLKLIARLPLKIDVNDTPKGNFTFQRLISRGELLVSGRGNGHVVSKQISIFTITPLVWNLGVFGGIVTALNRAGPR